MRFSPAGTWTIRWTKMPGVMMCVGIEFAGFDEMFDLGDGHLGGGRHVRIEVARRLAIDEIAFGVALPGVDDGDVGEEAVLHHVWLAVEIADFLALGDDGADAGAGEEGRDAGAAGANALGQRALRIELELQLAGQIKLGEQLVFADVGRNHLLDLARLQQTGRAPRRRCRRCWRRKSDPSRRTCGWRRSERRESRTARSRRTSASSRP